tara:strand:- start:4756 stop:4962 length:207 start_codon:yes stop_codon:yes gene_type:complete
MQYNNITKDMENILNNELKQKQLIEKYKFNKAMTYKGYYKHYKLIAYVGLFTIILQLIIIIQLLTNGV